MNNDNVQVPASFDSLSSIRTYVMQAASAAGLEHKRAYRLQLAVDEIATNVVTHGGGSEQPDAYIRVSHEITDECLTIVLEDNSHPFDPTQQTLASDINAPLEERPIGGLGVYLALKNVDTFTYKYANQHNRNILVMYRQTPPPETQ
ncbi:MAG: ATP-binding protein [Chloroflexaceae bacterium]|nr:ATP-binding protein [Chloroflexaceae bacterium]